jgi:membrane protein
VLEHEPELREPKLADPRLRDLTLRDWVAVFRRAVAETFADGMPLVSSAVAYSSFFAIPSVLLLVVGLFTLTASPETISELMDRFGTFIPAEAAELLEASLRRLNDQPSTGVAITVVGLVLAVWASTSAMSAYMRALNMAYDRVDGRSFVRRRLIALLLVGAIGGAVLILGVMLIFGPYAESYVSDLLGADGEAFTWAWWSLQWPFLFLGLLVSFGVLHYFGPDVEHRRWQLITPGALVAAVGWLLASGGFAVFTSLFANYNKTWGSLSAVIVTLTWLWLTGFVLLFGGEVNAEVERSRELRQGRPAGERVLAPRRSDSPD